MSRPPKILNLIDAVRQCARDGNYTEHGELRMLERGFTDADVQNVLLYGWWEKRKDQFDTVFNTWKYALRGKSFDGDRTIRVVVAFDDDGMLIITVIDVDA